MSKTEKAKLLNLFKIKTYLLCYGIRENEYSQEFYNLQNPYDLKKSGYVGLHFILDNQFPTLTSTTNRFDKKSQFIIVKEKDQFYIKSDGGERIPISPIIMPEWYKMKTSSHKPLPTIFAHEGLHYLHQLYSGCAFKSQGMGCKFCGINTQWLNNSPAEIAESAILAFKENNTYQVCLGGGTRQTPGRGSEFFLECIKQIRLKNKKVQIWIEMTPPDNDDYIVQLIQVGANGFGFNLEIWDDILRKEICPGKSQIPKSRYFSAWKFVQKHLGNNRVNTALLSGLEPFESTLEGIHEISKEKVRITLLPFKPWDNSEYEKREPANPEDHFKLALELAKDIQKYDIDPSQNLGCANCESCTIEDNILRYVLNK